MTARDNKSDVQQLTGILDQFSTATLIEAAGNCGLSLVSSLTPRGVTEGGIKQTCGGDEERYWQAIGNPVNGTISVTNTGDCEMTMRVEYSDLEATETIRNGQTKAITNAFLRSLHIKCSAEPDEGECKGTWRLSN